MPLDIEAALELSQGSNWGPTDGLDLEGSRESEEGVPA